MAKYNYFEKLEQLSLLAKQAVMLGCSDEGTREKQSFSSLRISCDRTICELEDALFSDFLPPLERDSIAACAHCLSRVVDQASELSLKGATPLTSQSNEEGQKCILLAEQLHRAVAMLRTINKPDRSPDTQGYRNLLASGRAAHSSMLAKIHSGALPRSALQTVILTGRLRAELSRAFDEVVEIMLNNI